MRLSHSTYSLTARSNLLQAPTLTTTQLAQYRLTWPRLTGALGYIIERSTDPTFATYSVIAGLNETATSFDDTEVSANSSTPYYYRIRASNSTTYSCPGAVPTVLVTNSTLLSGATVDSRWWGEYAKKATKWGFMTNSQFPTIGNLPILTANDAANAVVRAAKSLGVTAYQSLTFSCGQESNAAFYYLRSRGLIPGLLLPTSTITLGQTCSLVAAVLLDGTGPAYPTRNRQYSNLTVSPNAPYASVVNRAIRTLGRRSSSGGNKAEWLLSGPPSITTTVTVTGNETIHTGWLAKLLTGAYEAKYFQINRVPRQARIATDLAKSTTAIIGEDPDDYILIGDQHEFDTESDGEVPSLSAVGQTVSLTSGQSYTIGVSTNLLNNGQRVYFFWSLDGLSQGIQMVPLRSDFGQVRITAPAVSTPQTFHLYVYLAAENGNRGEYFQDIIVSPASTTGNTGGSSGNLSRMEYFMDTDPGLGLARAAGGIGSNNQTVDIPIDLAGYTPGLHVFGVRARDTQGRWSHTHSRPLLISAGGVSLPLTGLEYFFDTDPGYGQATPVPISPDALTYAADLGVSAAGLEPGLHTLHLRAKNSAEGWSHTHVRPVVVLGALAGSGVVLDRVEYFVDNDPGFGNGTPAQFPAGTTNLADIAIPVNLNNLSGGLHLFSVRARTAGGQWSATHSRPFIIGAGGIASPLTKLEYFFDADPGFGLGAALPITGNPTEFSAVLNMATQSLTEGLHTLYMRAQSSTGGWSHTHVRPFIKLAALSSQITRVECFVDTDPGQGNGQLMNSTPASGSDVVALLDLSVTSLTVGAHRLFARARDDAGQWSATQSASFTVLTACNSPTAILSGSQTITTGQTATVLVVFSGSSPWSLTLTNGQSFSNLTASTLSIPASPTTNTTYALASVRNNCGPGVVGGTAVITVLPAFCASMYSVKAGNWNDPTVWSCNRVPASSDEVEVRHTVTMPNAITGVAKQVRYQGGGKLILNATATLRLGL